MQILPLFPSAGVLSWWWGGGGRRLVLTIHPLPLFGNIQDSNFCPSSHTFTYAPFPSQTSFSLRPCFCPIPHTTKCTALKGRHKSQATICVCCGNLGAVVYYKCTAILQQDVSWTQQIYRGKFSVLMFWFMRLQDIITVSKNTPISEGLKMFGLFLVWFKRLLARYYYVLKIYV